MTRLTISRVSSETSSRPFRTRDTVAIETPARSAICLIVSRCCPATCAMALLKHVPERYGTGKTPFGRNLRREGLDSWCENVVTVPETLSETLFLRAPGDRARKAG